MNSTTSETMTSSLMNLSTTLAPNITSNSTRWWREISIDIFPYETRIAAVVIGVVICVIGITMNVGIAGTILSEQKLRKSLLLWCVLGLCLSNILMGVIVIPLNISRLHTRRWLHGYEVCKTVLFLEGLQFALSSCFSISLNLNCILRVMRAVDPIKQRYFVYTRLLPYALFIFPWIFVVSVCLPLMIEGEISRANIIMKQSNICFYAVKRDFYYAVMFMTVIVPFVVLMVVTTVGPVYYKIKSPHWQRFCQETEEDSNKLKIQTSILATTSSSISLMVAKIPSVILVIIFHFCQSRSCLPSLTTYVFLYQWTWASIIFSVFPWIMYTDIRQRFLELLARMIKFISVTCNALRGSRSRASNVNVWSPKKSELLENNES